MVNDWPSLGTFCAPPTSSQTHWAWEDLVQCPGTTRSGADIARCSGPSVEPRHRWFISVSTDNFLSFSLMAGIFLTLDSKM
jgi:hypothetical protein